MRVLACSLILVGMTPVWGQGLEEATPSPTNAPAEATGAVPHGLVNVNTITPPLLAEVRYATTYNFTGRVLYPSPAVYVQADVAEALRKVQVELATEGLGLKIYDGYRPFSVQVMMWKAVPDERYVSNPSKGGGKHTRGTAVDVTLVDAKGNELEMPTEYDDFTNLAHREAASSWTTIQRKNSRKLEAVMAKHGFIPFPFEWWHFDFHNWKDRPPLDVSFPDLEAGEKTSARQRNL